jgi:hypothetical protein
MKDQMNEQEQESKMRGREARRDRLVEWAKVAATALDAVSRFLRP